MHKTMILILFLLITLPVQAQESKSFDPCNPVDYHPIDETYKRGLLFKISKCGVADSYLLGTMHSDLPQVRNAIPRAVWTILAQAKSASFELKEDESMQAEIISAMYYEAGSGVSLRSTIGEDLYAKLQQSLDGKRDDLSAAMYDKMRPWAVGLLMQVPADTHDGIHLDQRLENFALEKSVPVFGLETVTEQLSVFTSLSQAEQLEFLQEAIDDFDMIEKMNDKMLSQYLQGNLAGLQTLAVKSFDMMGNVELREKLKETLIKKRNLLMLERMQPRLSDGNAFIAVGALHLPAQDGLLNLLEQGGYYIHVVR